MDLHVTLTSPHLTTMGASLMSGSYANHPSMDPILPRGRALRTIVSRASKGTTLVPPRYQALRTVVSKASKGIMPSALSAEEYSTEKKPRWWWRTLACIPYLMPLHVMSIYAEGAHRFLPFLQNFEILTDPFFGNQLPSWFMIVYCLGVYFFIVRRKQWPHFFRFHAIMAMLLDNAVQITGIVVGWMPYWSKIDAPFWTVFACGLLIAMFGCIRGALRGTYADTPFFSEAAFIHTYLP